MDVLEGGVHCSEMQGNIHIDLVAVEEIWCMVVEYLVVPP